MFRSLFFALLVLFLATGFTNVSQWKSSEEQAVEVLILPLDEQPFSTSSIQVAFLNGWANGVEAEVYGYTATDDLWTLLLKSAPAPAYDELHIIIPNPEAYYPNLNTCLQDIQSRSSLLSSECKLILL